MSDYAWDFIHETLDEEPQIAVVEDDPGFREVYPVIMQNLPVQIETFPSYDDFSEALESDDRLDSVEGAISDYSLNRSNTGLDAVEKFYEEEDVYKHSALVTSKSHRELEGKPLQDIYINKPVSNDAIRTLGYVLLVGSAQEKMLQECSEQVLEETKQRCDPRVDTQALMEEFQSTYSLLSDEVKNIEPENSYSVQFQRIEKPDRVNG